MINWNQSLFEEYCDLIFHTDSPSGYTGELVEKLKERLTALGYACKVHNKGTLECIVPGEDDSITVATSAHVDTLGLMVRSVTGSGTLKLTKVGGPITATLDGEYCTVVTRDGRHYTGTVLSQSPAAHVFPDAGTRSRDIDELELRLDEEVKNGEDVKALGIRAGDFVCIDPKMTLTPSGFLKSRFIDDKASAVLIMMLLEAAAGGKLRFRHPTRVYFSVFEEVGHGASAIDPCISEFVTVDMGCVGLDLGGNEYAVSICAKDSGGPYDYELTSRLIRLAEQHELPFTVDIFPFYGSDVGAARDSGRDFKGALIGSGVSASHGMERTHRKGLEATLRLLYLYLCGEAGERK